MTSEQADRAVLAIDTGALWAVLSDLTTWARWCPGVADASLDGPLQVGQTGALALAMPVVGAVDRPAVPGGRGGARPSPGAGTAATPRDTAGHLGPVAGR